MEQQDIISSYINKSPTNDFFFFIITKFFSRIFINDLIDLIDLIEALVEENSLAVLSLSS